MTATTKQSPRTVRGTATIHLDDRIEFKPYAQGESTQRNVKSCKGGKTFETTSEKAPQRVAHLSCPADCADPYAEYIEQLARLGIKPQKEGRLSEKQRLVSEGGMDIYLNAKQGKVTYQGCIDLTQSRNWQSEVMRQLQVIVRRLPAEEKFKKVINKIKKGGNK